MRTSSLFQTGQGLLTVTLALSVALAVTAPAADDTPSAMFPFVLPWDDATPGFTDLSGALSKPAGKLGHIRVGADGHFYAGEQRIRFIGVNVSFAGGLPSKPDAPKVAARLAKFGVNVVRFHHLDTSKWPDGLRAREAKDTGTFEPEALDRLHYFMAQLKERGLYANINLLVGRPFNAADGLPAEIEALDWKERHVVGFFDAKHLELQKDYARKLLSAQNPYTGLPASADPAVAFVEINNENGLVHAWLGGQVDRFPEIFLRDLQQQWNNWLRRHYAATAKLREAWSVGATTPGAEMLTNGAFNRELQGWGLEKHGDAQATVMLTNDVPPPPRPGGRAVNSARIDVGRPGGESWHVQFTQSGLTLESGKAYTLRFWAKADAPRALAVSASQAHEPWTNLGLSANAQLSNHWREFRFVFNPRQTDARARISFSNLGGAGGSIWLAGLTLRPGGVDGLRPGERLEDGSVARFEKKSFGERTAVAQRDWMRFLMDTEENYWQAMYRFLKGDLKVKALVTGTIGGCAPLNLMAKMDWVDTHAYWQHPRFPGRPWDAANWIVENRSMVNERGGTLPRLAGYRVAGKPHACTEYNHAAPNTYGSEAFLLLAAYAALQDWDAIYAYSYAHSRKDGWDGRKINGFFDIDQHPTKMASLAAAAALFARGDVKPARDIVVADLPREREVDLLRGARSWELVHAGTSGLAREAVLVHRIALATEGVAQPADAARPDSFKVEGKRFVSDTGELVWDLSEPGRGVVTVNTPRSKAVIGFGGGKRFELGPVVIEPGDGLQKGWSAITVTAMEGPESAPTKWLIIATGQTENTGMKWQNTEKSSVGRDWGAAPARVEGVSAQVTFAQPAAQLTAWSLDERGQRKERIRLDRTSGNTATVGLGPQWRTLWYEVSAASP